MHTVDQQTWLVDGILVTIVLSYLVIAAQFFMEARKHPKSEFKTSLTQLMLIFIFCSLCGYLPRLIDLSEVVVLVAHVILLACSWLYMVSRQIHILAGSSPFSHSHRETMEKRDE